MTAQVWFVGLALVLMSGCAVEAAPDGEGTHEPTVGLKVDAPSAHLRIAQGVVYYSVRPDCSDGEESFGLDTKGAHPDVAFDARYVYPVTGVWDAPVYVRVGDRCEAGGDYDGYDLFTLGVPVPR